MSMCCRLAKRLSGCVGGSPREEQSTGGGADGRRVSITAVTGSGNVMLACEMVLRLWVYVDEGVEQTNPRVEIGTPR